MFGSRVTLTVGQADLLGGRRMALLEAIERTGSISAAARAASLSYKAAWDNVAAINNLAQQPVVVRAKGGRGGGGSHLTAFGCQLLGLYRELDENQRTTALAAQWRPRAGKSAPAANTLGALALRTSARNQYLGTISRIVPGAVSSEVVLDLGDGLSLTSIITRQSVKDLGLRKRTTAIALVKSSFVVLAVGGPIRTSARNVLPGTVARITRGAVNAEVQLELAGHRTLVATITCESLDELGLAVGSACQALVKSSHVLMAVLG